MNVLPDPPLLQRLTASDLFVLLWDDLGWSGDIGALAILDGTTLLDPDGQVRVEVVRRQIESRLHLLPRFRQRLYRPPPGLGWPLWVDAASFDITDHVAVVPLRAPVDEAQLLQSCAELARQRLNLVRPLWKLWLLPGLPEGRVGLFFKLHHAVADGVAGVAAFGALLDPNPTVAAAAPIPPAWVASAPPTRRELLHDNVRRRLEALGRARSSLTGAAGTLRQTRRALPAWREFFAERRAPRTSLNRPIGDRRRLAIIRTRLDLVKQIAHAHHATVNDTVLAAVAGGLGELLHARGEPVHELALRAMVPISLHTEQPGQANGNRDSVMVVPLPIGESDHARRLQLIAAQTAERKHKARPQVGSGIFGSALAQHAFVRLLARQRLMNITVTNVPGPPVPLYLAGAPLLEVFPTVSLVANLTLCVAVLSYAGQLNITAVADRDSCADLDIFADGVRRALDGLTRSVPVPAS